MDHIEYLEKAESTQDIVYGMARHGAQEWTAVCTFAQTAGRGRMGRKWETPHGANIALSFLLRPDCETRFAPLYGLMASVATVLALEHYCPRSDIKVKWPNDVIVDGRKIAGILPQAHLNGLQLDFVVIGLGLNVNSVEADFPPELRDKVTSVRCLTGADNDPAEIAESFLERMINLYDQSKVDGFDPVIGLWSRKWAHRGCVISRSGIEGTAEGIDELGALMVRIPDGSLVKLSGGETQFQA